MFQVRAWLSVPGGGVGVVGCDGWAGGGFCFSGIGFLSLGLPLNTPIPFGTQA